MAKESTRWKQKWNPGLRVARCCANCAHAGGSYRNFCGISPRSGWLCHYRGSSEVCDNWKAAEWAKGAYGDRLE